MEGDRVPEALAHQRHILKPGHRERPLHAERARDRLPDEARIDAVDMRVHVDDPVPELGKASRLRGIVESEAV
jgi:hypothetical protein